MREPLSIVIPVYNQDRLSYDYTLAAVESVLNQFMSFDDELIVVDDASPYHQELAPERLSHDFRGCHLITRETNGGFGVACNQGFLAAENNWIGQMNSDCELIEDTFTILQDVMKTFDLAVGMPEHYENCQHYGLGKEDVLMGKDWRFGACWLARAEVLHEMNGFDAETFEKAYWEDTDLWRRMETAGYSIAGWRGTWVKHKGNVSTGDLLRNTDIFKQNKARFEERWGPLS